jgi:hypothetical protein
LVAIAINDPTLLIAGAALVLVALVVGIFMAITKPERRGLVGVLSVVGLAALLGGIGITAYIALRGPSLAKAPDLDVSLSGSSTMTLTGEVKVSGIPENAHYWVEVDAREYTVTDNAGAYEQLGTPLYQAQLGADSQGNIDTRFGVPLAANQYPAVSVEAWYGDHAGPCGSLTVPGGANLIQAPVTSASATTSSTAVAQKAKAQSGFLEQFSRPGCVVVRLPTGKASVKR